MEERERIEQGKRVMKRGFEETQDSIRRMVMWQSNFCIQLGPFQLRKTPSGVDAVLVKEMFFYYYYYYHIKRNKYYFIIFHL